MLSRRILYSRREKLAGSCCFHFMACAILAFPAATMSLFLLSDNDFGCILTDIQSFLTGEIDIVSGQTRHGQQIAERIPGIRRYFSYLAGMDKNVALALVRFCHDRSQPSRCIRGEQTCKLNM